MSLLSDALDRLEALYPEAMKPGLSAAEIEALLEDFPMHLPEEFYELYQRSDGLNHRNPQTLFFGFGRLFSLGQAVEYYCEFCEYTNYYAGWFPILSLEELVYAIRGDRERQKTAPIIAFGYEDLSHRPDYDLHPAMKYPSLTETMVDAVYQLENPYG